MFRQNCTLLKNRDSKKDFKRTNYYTTEKTKVEFLKGVSHKF